MLIGVHVVRYPSVVLAALTLFAIAPAGAAPAKAPFGCDARAPGVCHFRIYYTPKGSRNVVLPAGMKQQVPGVEIGRDTYCVALNVAPAPKCARKVINAQYNN
jgi:hypothetical protein